VLNNSLKGTADAPAMEQTADQKADTPAPGADIFDGHRFMHDQVQQRGEEYPGVHAEEDDAHREAGTARRGFDHVRDRARQFAAQTEALDDAQHDQQNRRGDAPLRIRRQQADADRGAGHCENRDDQHLAAADLVADMAEEDATQRPREIADREYAEGHDQRHGRVVVGVEIAADVLRELAVDDEVVEFERAAQTGQQNHAPVRPRYLGCYIGGRYLACFVTHRFFPCVLCLLFYFLLCFLLCLLLYLLFL
jgi:hypothetical protein